MCWCVLLCCVAPPIIYVAPTDGVHPLALTRVCGQHSCLRPFRLRSNYTVLSVELPSATQIMTHDVAKRRINRMAYLICKASRRHTWQMLCRLVSRLGGLCQKTGRAHQHVSSQANTRVKHFALGAATKLVHQLCMGQRVARQIHTYVQVGFL